MASPEPTLPDPVLPRPAPLLGPTTASTLLVAATGLAALLEAWAVWYRHGVATDYAAGVPGVWVADLTSADSTTRMIGVLYLLSMTAATLALLVWLSRVRSNARLLGPPAHPMWRRAAVGGWFVSAAVGAVLTVRLDSDTTVAELETIATADSVTAVAQCVVGALVIVVVRRVTGRGGPGAARD